MRFINSTGNTVKINDIDINVPFLGEVEQEIDSDSLMRSPSLQSLFVASHFIITEVNDTRIEQNLQKLQTRTLPAFSLPDEQIVKTHIKGQFGNHTGYAKANRNLLLALSRSGVQVTIEPTNSLGGGAETTKLKPFISTPLNKSIFVHSTIPTFAEKLPSFPYSIIYTTVESSTVPNQFIEACNAYDEVWTTSDFCKEVLVRHGVSKAVHVMPNSVDTRLYGAFVCPIPIKPAPKAFTFLSVFGWNYRKGYDALLKAYLHEFTANDDVSLLIVSKYNTDGHGNRKKTIEKEIKRFIKEYGGESPAHIARCGIDVTEVDMPRLYKSCQCFILPSRGEGFGIPFMEASICGLPIIATNHSGHTMFLNERNSYLVNIDKISRIPAQTTNVHFWDNQEFPELTSDSVISALRAKMRYVYENYEEAKKVNSVLQKEIMSQYTTDIAGALVKQRLEQIWDQI